MTEKLYYSNPFEYEADCRVTEITEKNGVYAIVAERTPFFPEGGGQPCDNGFCGNCKISDCQEKDGIIYHYTKNAPSFKSGDTVRFAIDGKKRFARMQAHTGEHIVSGVAHNLFGVENVGFHMEDTVMTVDFDKPLTDEDIALIQHKANEAVWDNRAVTTAIYTPEEAKEQTYRSKKDFDTDIRIVTIDGIDACACCAPHLDFTGRTGLIMITSRVSHRGGVRITLVCGETAAELAFNRFNQVKLMAGMLVEKQDECVNALSVYMQKSDEARFEANALRDRICRITADSVAISDDKITVAKCGLTPAEMTKTGAILRKKAVKPLVLLSGNDEDGYAYMITADNYPLRAKAKEFNTALDGRGGGRDEMIQGFFRKDFNTIKAFFEEYAL